jgi:hypothetical protein
MKKYNIKLQSYNCEFLREEISYLGHVTVSPDEKRAEALRSYPLPKTT